MGRRNITIHINNLNYWYGCTISLPFYCDGERGFYAAAVGVGDRVGELFTFTFACVQSLNRGVGVVQYVAVAAV